MSDEGASVVGVETASFQPLFADSILPSERYQRQSASVCVSVTTRTRYSAEKRVRLADSTADDRSLPHSHHALLCVYLVKITRRSVDRPLFCDAIWPGSVVLSDYFCDNRFATLYSPIG